MRHNRWLYKQIKIEPAHAGFLFLITIFDKFLNLYWQIFHLCYYAIMSKKGHFIDISNIVKFFDLIIFDHNASRTEYHNFLQDCLKFVFDYHNLNVNDYNVELHSIKMEKNGYLAYMQQKATQLNGFDVYLNHDHLVFKEYNGESLRTLFSLMFTAMHEFGHIVQYIENSRRMVKAAIREYDVTLNLNKKVDKINDRKKQNLVVAQCNRHFYAMDAISNIERNADYQAYKYCQILFNTMYEQEENEVIKTFYAYGIRCFNKLRQKRYELYRISDKDNKQAIKILNKNGIKKEDLLNK